MLMTLLPPLLLLLQAPHNPVDKMQKRGNLCKQVVVVVLLLPSDATD